MCGSVLAPGGPLANSSRLLAICEIKAKIDAHVDPKIKKWSLGGVEIRLKSFNLDHKSCAQELFGRGLGSEAAKRRDHL